MLLKGVLNMNACRLVMITWEDSRQPRPSWSYLSDLPESKSVLCTTVGWLLKDEDGVKVVAQSMGDIQSEDGMQASGVMVIPARCVVSVDALIEESVNALVSGQAAVSTPKLPPTLPKLACSDC
jgi:hypothetical protein